MKKKEYISEYQKELTKSLNRESAGCAVCFLLIFALLFLLMLDIIHVSFYELWGWLYLFFILLSALFGIGLFCDARDKYESLSCGRFWDDFNFVYFAGTITARFCPRSVTQKHLKEYLKDPQFTVSIITTYQTKEIAVEVSDSEYAMHKIGETVYVQAQQFLDIDGSVIKSDYSFLQDVFEKEYSCEVTDVCVADEETKVFLRCKDNHRKTFIVMGPRESEINLASSVRVVERGYDLGRVKDEYCSLITLSLDALPGLIFRNNGELLHRETLQLKERT